MDCAPEKWLGVEIAKSLVKMMNNNSPFKNASRESKDAAKAIMTLTVGIIIFSFSPGVFICGLALAALTFIMLNSRRTTKPDSESPTVREGVILTVPNGPDLRVVPGT